MPKRRPDPIYAAASSVDDLFVVGPPVRDDAAAGGHAGAAAPLPRLAGADGLARLAGQEDALQRPALHRRHHQGRKELGMQSASDD